MCGIVGLYLKNDALSGDLGRLTAEMLHEMRDRGPDSAGFAVYGDPEPVAKLVVLSEDGSTDWSSLTTRCSKATGRAIETEVVRNHAVLRTEGDGIDVRSWLIAHAPDVTVLSLGHAIEVFKGIGDPDLVAQDFGLAGRTGTHAIAHTRMATESAVTTAGSHPFSTGADTCLVHNGSLSNHNRLRRVLTAAGERFQTENDSEVAAGFLANQMRGGESLAGALRHALTTLDGFYTFAIGTADGFAVLRDPIACKPAVMAETDDWVAMASEFRAIAVLPGVNNAHVWEPVPAEPYSWGRAA